MVTNRIYIQAHGKTVTNLCSFSFRTYCVLEILKTLESSVYKINYYPHTCYVATDNLIKIHDFYGCVSKTSHYLPKDKLIPILGKMDVWRFGQYESDGLINMQQVYEMAFKVNSGEWPVIGNIK